MAQQQSKRKRKRIDGPEFARTTLSSVKRMGVEDEQQSKKNCLSIILLPSRLLLPEIIVEILLRFPVETLLRCKSVCKSWYSLIASRYFINSHVRLWTRRHQYVHPRLIFSRPFKRVSLTNPSFRAPVFVIGSCNGLLCIVQDGDTPFLYNRSTRIYKRLPYSGLYGSAGYTFGYDESSDDYKVVGLTTDYKLAKIYSLKSGRWKDMNDVPCISQVFHRGTFSNGAFHWMICEMVREVCVRYHRLTNIVSFDLATETFGEVFPPRLYDKCDGGISLKTLGEWLCVIAHYNGIRADLWVMKAYGVKDSWTKLVSIPYNTGFGIYLPVSMSNDGKFLLTLDTKLVVYDSMNCSFTKIHEFDEMLSACTHVDSLVSPHHPLDAEQIEEFS